MNNLATDRRQTYARLRAACCDETGLTGEHALDYHALGALRLVESGRARVPLHHVLEARARRLADQTKSATPSTNGRLDHE